MAVLMIVAIGLLALGFGQVAIIDVFGMKRVNATPVVTDPTLELPAALIDATRGADSVRKLEGESALLRNASMAFSRAPVEQARPFHVGGVAAADQQRALTCLTQAVYYEAGFEPGEGRRAVAQVVLNRVRHPAFPNSVCGVVYDGATRPGCQFSFTCDGSLRRSPSPGAWQSAAQIAREALSGHVAASVGHATHYHANYVSPYWAPRLTKIQQIGAHIFYRWPGGWGRPAAFSSGYAGGERILQPPSLAGEAPALIAQAALPDITDRRAPDDVGGRLDVTKGWTLDIPTPDASRTRMAGIISNQVRAAPANGSAPPQQLARPE
jgi:spore germination cell wall hydrolase CwlJ-like protein